MMLSIAIEGYKLAMLADSMAENTLSGCGLHLSQIGLGIQDLVAAHSVHAGIEPVRIGHVQVAFEHT
jgi:hypothetical protein